MAINGPLTGYKVLDMTQFESGTTCTEILAWMGADVYKIERPVKGELGRFSAADPTKDTNGFCILNMNKKSVTCNAKSPEGQKMLIDAIAKCDIFVENMGPGSADRLGLSYEECKKVNPGIIYASIKGFDPNGPYKDYPAFDPIAEHTGVMLSVTGKEDEPIKPGVNVADAGSGTMMALAIIAACLQREKTGEGQRVDLAMQDFMIGLARSQWEPYYDTGKPSRRVGNGMPMEDVAPSGTFPCKPFGPNDYVHVYCSRHPGSKQWDNLCDAIGRPELKQDVCPEMATPRLRYQNLDMCHGAIANWMKDHTKYEAMDILAKADVPAGAILSTDDIQNDPQYEERGLLVHIQHPQRGDMKLVGFAPKMSGLKIEYKTSPALGDANDEFLKDVLGYSDAEVADLKDKKVI